MWLEEDTSEIRPETSRFALMSPIAVPRFPVAPDASRNWSVPEHPTDRSGWARCPSKPVFGAIFPSAVGRLRDPSGFARQWREVRGGLGDPLPQ